MKKRINLTAFSCIVMLFVHFLASCSLDMTDWVTSEEEKGYGDIEEVETPYYNVKYQYKDNTRSLTDNILQYFVNVEEDTVLYFMDNLPSEWTPEVGGQVVCNCCPEFPMGLLGKVLSVERNAGMLKVTTTPCEIADAYEEFDLDMDMDLITSNNPAMTQTTTETTPSTRSGGPGEKTVKTIDWTMFNLATDGRKVICKKGAATRSPDDDYPEDYFSQDREIDTTTMNEYPIVTFDQDNEPIKSLLNDKVKKYINKAEISLSYVSRNRIEKHIRASSRYERTIQTESTGLKLAVSAGRSTDIKEMPKSDAVKSAEFMDRFTKYLIESGQAIAQDDPLPLKGPGDPEMQFLKEIPCFSLPIGFVVRIRPVFDFSVSMIGQGEIIFWNAKTKTEATFINGEKYEEEPKKLPKPANEYSASLSGKFNISGGVEAFLGMGKVYGTGPRAKAWALGGYITATVDFEGKIKYNFLHENNLNGCEDSGITLNANVQFGLMGLGGRWGSYKFISSDKIKVWDGLDLKFFPKVNVNKQIDVIIDKDKEGRTYKDFAVRYTFPNLGIYASYLYKHYRPRLRIYKGDNTDDALGDYEDIPPTPTVTFVNTDKEYFFEYSTYDANEKFTVVPVLLREGEKGKTYTVFYDNKRLIDDAPRPMVKYFPDMKEDSPRHIIYQTMGDVPTVDMGVLSGLFDNMAGSTKYTQYGVCLPFYMFNGSSVDKAWSDFGIRYKITYIDNQGKRHDIQKFKSLYSKIKKSGYYKPSVNFLLRADYTKVSTEIRLYYVLKEDSKKTKLYMDTADAWNFTVEKYLATNQVGSYYIRDDIYELAAPFISKEREWEKEFAKHSVKNIDISVEP